MSKPNVGTIDHIDYGHEESFNSDRVIVIKARENTYYELIGPVPLQPNKGPKKKRGKGNKWHR